MASVSFFITRKKLDKKGRAQIMLQCVHEKEKFRIFTGEKIEPKYWSDSKKNPIKPSYNDDGTLALYLQNLEKKITDLVRDSKTEGKFLSIDRIKASLQEQPEEIKESSFFPLFDQFIASSAATRTAGTIKNYKNSLHYFKEFSKAKKFDFQLEALNMAFYNKFITYLIKDVGLSNNTVGRNIKVLKTFLNWATDNGYNTSLDYKKFKMFQEPSETIYLTDKELKALYKLKISNPAADRARDLFCFGCYTGLRFSDVATLSRANISNDEIRIRTQKTKDILSIPLLPQAKAILEKYDYNMPVLSNQKLNQHLKKLGEKAKITEEVNIQKYRGAERIDDRTPKYKLLTTHTARRTFITLSLEKGIRQEVVMSITGHKNFRTFSAYVKIVDKVKKQELFKAWK